MSYELLRARFDDSNVKLNKDFKFYVKVLRLDVDNNYGINEFDSIFEAAAHFDWCISFGVYDEIILCFEREADSFDSDFCFQIKTSEPMSVPLAVWSKP